MKLRLLDNLNDFEVHNLPVVFQGTKNQCATWAKKNGYKWRYQPNLLFKGYFSHPSGKCLFITS